MKKLSRKYRAYLKKRSQAGQRFNPRRLWVRKKRSLRSPSVSFVFEGFTALGDPTTTVSAQTRFHSLSLAIAGAKTRQRPVVINLREHRGFDPVALMRFLLIIRGASGNGVAVRGNLPRDDYARQQLNDIGFFSNVAPAERCVRLRTGTTPCRQTAIELAQLLAKDLALPNDSPEIERRLIGFFYTPLFECIQNVCAHAGGGDPLSRPKWYAFGYRDPVSSTATAVVGDVGVGIPRSLKSKNRRLREIFKADASFIRDTLREGRSSHGGRGRGKGLRELRRWAERGASLVVASGDAIVIINRTDEHVKKGWPQQRGTIVSFAIAANERLALVE